MKNAIRALDKILRGDATRLPLLRQGTFDIPAGGLLGLIVVLSMIYGACMGSSAVITRWSDPTRFMGFQQLGASIVKVPALFLLTLIITFPSLYVFNALIGSRLTVGAMLRLLVAAMFMTDVTIETRCTDCGDPVKMMLEPYSFPAFRFPKTAPADQSLIVHTQPEHEIHRVREGFRLCQITGEAV